MFTEPPYFGNIQYSELMDFCYVWLRRLVGQEPPGFDRESTRSPEEIMGNLTHARGLEQFTEGLASVYRKMACALKPGAPLAFTYHHNKLEAYYPVGVAILDCGFSCSASLPCPAEMSSSIHINGTSSSIVDTVFVCRSAGFAPPQRLFCTVDQMSAILQEDLAQLVESGMKPTLGDTRCILFGHATRMAIWNLKDTWQAEQPTQSKLDRFAEAIAQLADLNNVIQSVWNAATASPAASQTPSLDASTGEVADAVSL